jgi:hypothetical protein
MSRPREGGGPVFFFKNMGSRLRGNDGGLLSQNSPAAYFAMPFSL